MLLTLLFLYIPMFFRGPFVPALLPGQSTKMQPAALHSLSELERASLREIALYQLQKKPLVGDLSLAKGRGWERTAPAEGGQRSEPSLLLIPTPTLHNVG